MTASEKVAYLKGLAEGLGVKADGKDGKLMLAVIDVLESLAGDTEALEAKCADLADSIDDIGEDMAYLEDLCLADLGEDEDEYEDDECGGCCGCGGDEQEYEVTCPQCGEVITLLEDDLDFGAIRCPSCDAELEFDFDDDEDEDEDDD